MSNSVMHCKSFRFSYFEQPLPASLSALPGFTAHKHTQAQQYYGAQARPGATSTTSRKTKSRKKNKKKPPDLPSTETENQTKALLENSMLAACATRLELS